MIENDKDIDLRLSIYFLQLSVNQSVNNKSQL